MPPLRQIHFESGPAIELALDFDRAAETAYKGARMGKADAVARPVLDARAPEKIEDAFAVFGIDAAAVVAHLVGNRSMKVGRPDFDGSRHVGPQIFDGVIHEIGEHLLEGKAVAGDRRQVTDADFGVGRLGLIRQGLGIGAQQLLHFDQLRLKLALAFAREREKSGDQTIHFGD